MSVARVHPRKPTYKGVEEIEWSSVDKTFEGFIAAFYEHHTSKKPAKKEDIPSSFKDCSAEIRTWMSEHSLLGDYKSDTFDDGVILPVVNPHTGKLNTHALSSALTYCGRVKGISHNTTQEVVSMIANLRNDARKLLNKKA